jgi:hypothetical protein
VQANVDDIPGTSARRQSNAVERNVSVKGFALTIRSLLKSVPGERRGPYVYMRVAPSRMMLISVWECRDSGRVEAVDTDCSRCVVRRR